uniref:Uncharacterized protein n=1 Tax=Arundo donax TaxID=35708 RepID=A0A0A9EJ35_ARUDO
MASKEELDDAISALDGQVRTSSFLSRLQDRTLKNLHEEAILLSTSQISHYARQT